MIEFLNNLDTSVFLAINGHHSPFFDSFMTMFTGRFIWIPMYAMVLWILFRSCRWQTATIYLVALVGAICLTDQTCASVIRPAVERLRPSNLENTLSDFTYVVNGYRGGSYGFPSCHAANSFALALFVSLFVKRRGFTLFIFGWAAANSYSRLYLGVHYPGDLLVGALVGCAYGAACYYCATWLLTRVFPKISPVFNAPRDYSQSDNHVTLKQLTPGASLDALTPSASLQREIGTLTTSGPVASNLMIATFAVTLTVIIIASAIG